MAKKKKKVSKSNGGNSANALSRELAQISAQAQIQVQQIANQATEKSFQYNSQEAATARAFNSKEAAIARAFNKQEADTTRAYNAAEAAKTRAYNSQEAATARAFNAAEAKKARDWEQMMSNTSHQREVADLKKAGLNPVLSVNGGAQSYTTSSASANAASSSAASSSASSANPAYGDAASAMANDPSGSIGQLASTMMQGRIGAYEADKSAAATRYAAKQSAAATRYAAAQQASAAKYAASMNYQNYRMHEKWQNEYLEKETKAKIKIIEHTPVSSVGGVIDKFATKAGLYEFAGTKAVQGTKKATIRLLNNVNKYFKNDGKVTSKNFVLSKAGKALINMQLAQFGLGINKKNQLAFVRAFVFDKPKWQNYLITKIKMRRIYSYSTTLR